MYKASLNKSLSIFRCKYHKKLLPNNEVRYLRDKEAKQLHHEYIQQVGFYKCPLSFLDWLDDASIDI